MSALESGPATLAQLVSTTHLARPTAHRIAVAWSSTAWSPATPRDASSWAPGSPSWPAPQERITSCPPPDQSWRPCATRPTSRRSSTAARETYASAWPMPSADRAARLHSRGRHHVHAGRLGGPGASRLGGARPPAPGPGRGPLHRHHALGGRRRGWAQSVGEREPGVASVSAPVRGPGGKVVAAISISGPIERMGRQPGRFTDTWSWPRRAGSPRCSPTPVPSDGSRTSSPSPRRLRHPLPLRRRPGRWRAGRHRRASAPLCPTRPRGRPRSCGS